MRENKIIIGIVEIKTYPRLLGKKLGQRFEEKQKKLVVDISEIRQRNSCGHSKEKQKKLVVDISEISQRNSCGHSKEKQKKLVVAIMKKKIGTFNPNKRGIPAATK